MIHANAFGEDQFPSQIGGKERGQIARRGNRDTGTTPADEPQQPGSQICERDAATQQPMQKPNTQIRVI